LIDETKSQAKKLGGAKGKNYYKGGYLEETIKNIHGKMSFIDLAGSERAKDVTN
jgi:hypothetical protein